MTGVKGVTNLITVKPRVTATEVKAKIEQALKRDATLDAQHIQVQTSDGRVELKGTVRS